MIFSIQFALIFAGYGAVSNLSGQYVKYYTDASDFDLGLYFMIPHLLVFVRPIICAQADRHQSHKRLFTECLFGSALAYLPYIVMPYLVVASSPAGAALLSKQTAFWLLTGFHLVGSLCFNGVRALADATGMNHAKRVDCDYVSFRKWAPVGFGLCGFLFGLINQDNGLLPDFVASFVLYCACMLVLGCLVHIWPDEYYVMATESTATVLDHDDKANWQKVDSLPSNAQTLARIKLRLRRMLALSSAPADERDLEHPKQVVASTPTAAAESRDLSVRQQLSILMLIIRRDFRIPLALLLLVVGGWVCRSAQNFVFMHADKICLRDGTCEASSLAGLIIFGFSLLEFLTYVALEVNSRTQFCQLNRIHLIQLAILSIAAHYFSLAYLVERVSPYFFLTESLHGLEFALFISTCLNWGYMFASEVEYIIPELIERRIITQADNLELVKVSLVATMMSCMTLAYDGIGSMLGSLFYGWLIESRGSYSFAWLTNASLASATFVAVLLAVLLGKLFKIRPRILKLQDETIKASCC